MIVRKDESIQDKTQNKNNGFTRKKKKFDKNLYEIIFNIGIQIIAAIFFVFKITLWTN